FAEASGRALDGRGPGACPGRVRCQAGRTGRLPLRPVCASRAGSRTYARVRVTGHVERRSDALSGREHLVRRGVPARRAQLLEIELPARVERRSDQRAGRAIRCYAFADDRGGDRVLPWSRLPRRRVRYGRAPPGAGIQPWRLLRVDRSSRNG